MRPVTLLALALLLVACSPAPQPTTPATDSTPPATPDVAPVDAAPVAQLPHVRYYRINAG